MRAFEPYVYYKFNNNNMAQIILDIFKLNINLNFNIYINVVTIIGILYMYFKGKKNNN